MGWNIADVLEGWVRADPQAPSAIQGNRILDRAGLDRTAQTLARGMIGAGLQQGAKVTAFMPNRPEHLAVHWAAFKAGLTPFNSNYRYTGRELVELWRDADARAVVFDLRFAPTLDAIRGDLPDIALWVAVGDGVTPHWAVALSDLPDAGAEPFRAPWGRSGEDQLMVYTGGTTGRPKGVVWRLEDQMGGLTGRPFDETPDPDPESVLERFQGRTPPVTLVACPLMHGTGQGAALGALLEGGAVALLEGGPFDAEALWSLAERAGATRIGIVGSAFAEPMLEALERHAGRWNLSSVQTITSSGSMWRRENKLGLLRHLPQASLIDYLASSEAPPMGVSIMTADKETSTAQFGMTPACAVFDDQDRRLAPGHETPGRLAISGYLPLGYYRDEEKSQATFRIVDGRRWSFPGDLAVIEDEGRVRLLGRGSQCINTGGDKVFPEEVEESLKRHPAVRDALVVGLPDLRFGETVAAVIELREDADAPSTEALRAFVTQDLAAYKAPRRIAVVPVIPRGVNGKPDYAGARSVFDKEGIEA